MIDPEFKFVYRENPNPPSRPKINDREVARSAAIAAAEKIIRDWDWEGDFSEADIDALADVLRVESDGYRACRRLQDRYFWDPDSELVEILDHPFMRIAHEGAVRQWVIVNGIKPKLDIGTKVSFSKGLGEISGILDDVAQYLITTGPRNIWYADYETVAEVSQPSEVSESGSSEPASPSSGADSLNN